MCLLIVKRERNHAFDGVGWFKAVQVEFLLDIANVAIDLLKDSLVEALLAAEVVVDHALGRTHLGGDRINASAAQAMFGELASGHGKNVLTCAVRIGLARSCLRGALA